MDKCARGSVRMRISKTRFYFDNAEKLKVLLETARDRSDAETCKELKKILVKKQQYQILN